MNKSTYCKSCGAYIPTGQKKCLACGFPIEIPSLGGDKDKVETVPLDGVFYAISEKYYSKGKPDIDLDKLLKQEFFTVKIGGKVKWFYFGKADMEIGSTIYQTKDLFGHISINHSEKQKFHMVMIER